MKYGNRDITAMSSEELFTASLSLQKIVDDRSALKNTSKYQRRFKNQQEPGINPAFLELKQAIENELKNRNQ